MKSENNNNSNEKNSEKEYESFFSKIETYKQDNSCSNFSKIFDCVNISNISNDINLKKNKTEKLKIEKKLIRNDSSFFSTKKDDNSFFNGFYNAEKQEKNKKSKLFKIFKFFRNIIK